MRKPIEIPRHCAECMCSACELVGAGYFAQRAALSGDSTAAERLSPPVFALLNAQPARVSSKRRRGTA